jgi:hypothetical protein
MPWRKTGEIGKGSPVCHDRFDHAGQIATNLAGRPMRASGPAKGEKFDLCQFRRVANRLALWQDHTAPAIPAADNQNILAEIQERKTTCKLKTSSARTK